jgi:hypothetical protein
MDRPITIQTDDLSCTCFCCEAEIIGERKAFCPAFALRAHDICSGAHQTLCSLHRNIRRILLTRISNISSKGFNIHNIATDGCDIPATLPTPNFSSPHINQLRAARDKN